MGYRLRTFSGSLGGQIVTKRNGKSPNAGDIRHYPDTGCHLHRGSCLECPFEYCKKHELAVGKSYDGKNKQRRVN